MYSFYRMCFTVSPVRHKICVLYVEKIHEWFRLKMRQFFKTINHSSSRLRCVNIIIITVCTLYSTWQSKNTYKMYWYIWSTTAATMYGGYWRKQWKAVLRIRDVYPGSWILTFYPSRIPDLKTSTKERGEKKCVVYTFFCSHKFHKIVNYFIFEMLKKNIWPSFQRIVELFTQKFVTKL